MTSPAVLTVHLERFFTPEMDVLRRDGWDACLAGSARDEFDDESTHLVVKQAGRLVSMVRITMAKRSVLGTWSRHCAPLPHGRDIAELSRSVVVASMRRLGIYRLVMLETVLRLRAMGARLATAAIEPDFPGRSFLAELGFVAVGQPVFFDDFPRSRTLAQSILLDMTVRREAKWEGMRRLQLERCLATGYMIESDLPARECREMKV